MYKIDVEKENNLNFLELKNTDNSSFAKISLNEGGRLQELKLNATNLIQEQPNFEYKNSYASAILFPFTNRIENGKYSFKNEEHQLFSNENNSNNSIHGLVYNKEFKVLEQKTTSDSCSITIYYSETEKQKGFPFKYSIFLSYTLSKENILLGITIINEDTKAFPFTLGWHPYFISDNLFDSSLNFESNKKVVFDENLITREIQKYEEEKEFKIEDKKLDDCFIVSSPKIDFLTPNYSLEISSSSNDNFLQLYTPKGLPLIAIEPMTGISNSFNNKIGLQVLEANEKYSLKWNVKIL